LGGRACTAYPLGLWHLISPSPGVFSSIACSKEELDTQGKTLALLHLQRPDRRLPGWTTLTVKQSDPAQTAMSCAVHCHKKAKVHRCPSEEASPWKTGQEPGSRPALEPGSPRVWTLSHCEQVQKAVTPFISHCVGGPEANLHQKTGSIYENAK
jgi:hypothetical protein